MGVRLTAISAIMLSSIASVGFAEAACISPAPVNAAAIEAFKANPQGLLSRFPDAGGALVSEIRNIAVSDGSAVAAIAGLMSGSSPAQVGSIGTGLGQAAAICASREPQTAEAIQAAVLAASNSPLMLAFQAVTGDFRTTAVGGGAGGGAGGGGSLGGSGTGSTIGNASGGGLSRTTNSITAPNSVFSFSTGSGQTPTLATTSAVLSVSP